MSEIILAIRPEPGCLCRWVKVEPDEAEMEVNPDCPIHAFAEIEKIALGVIGIAMVTEILRPDSRIGKLIDAIGSLIEKAGWDADVRNTVRSVDGSVDDVTSRGSQDVGT